MESIRRATPRIDSAMLPPQASGPDGAAIDRTTGLAVHVEYPACEVPGAMAVVDIWVDFGRAMPQIRIGKS